MYERLRVALYGLAASLNTLALALGWWTEPVGVAVLGAVNAGLMVLALVNVPAIHDRLRPPGDTP
jgi:uncharacterized integral membrane protein